MRLLKFFVAVFICAVASRVFATSWMPVPLKTLVEISPTVIVGKIERVGVAKPTENACGTAYIRVGKVIKNTAKDIEVIQGKEVPLSIPRSVSLNELRSRYAKGTEGVWILGREHKSATFWATYPNRLQPLTEESNITAIVADQQTETAYQQANKALQRMPYSLASVRR